MQNFDLMPNLKTRYNTAIELFTLKIGNSKNWYVKFYFTMLYSFYLNYLHIQNLKPDVNSVYSFLLPYCFYFFILILNLRQFIKNRTDNFSVQLCIANIISLVAQRHCNIILVNTFFLLILFN